MTLLRNLRNILNTLFILVALVGMYLYFKDDDFGTTLIFVAMGLKFVEVVIRLLKLEEKF